MNTMLSCIWYTENVREAFHAVYPHAVPTSLGSELGGQFCGFQI